MLKPIPGALFPLLLSSLLLLPLSAQATLRVFACEPELEALAKELGGDLVSTYVATHARQDVHHIQARPSLINRVRRADLVICTGASLEVGWLPVLLKKGANAKVQQSPGLFLAAEQVERLEINQQADRSKGDVHPMGNPHVFLDPMRLLQIAEKLGQRLAELDAPNHRHYQANVADFKQRWQQAVVQWEKKAAVLRGKTVVAHHRSWTYLLHWLGMEQIASLEPLPGIPPSSGHLSRLVKQMEKNPVYAIIRSPFADKKGSRWLAKKTAICAVELPFTVGGSEMAKDLFSLFDVTVDQLLSVQHCRN